MLFSTSKYHPQPKSTNKQRAFSQFSSLVDLFLGVGIRFSIAFGNKLLSTMGSILSSSKAKVNKSAITAVGVRYERTFRTSRV